MKKISLKINGIMCDKCRQTIKNAISNLTNIKDVNVKEDTAINAYENDSNKEERVNKINDIGFETSIEKFKY